jgi:excisionase family DNA binding protein
MAQISLSEDSVVQAEREPLTQSSDMQVAATPNSEPVRRHSPRQKRPHSRTAAKAKLLPEAKLLVSREEAAQLLSISIRGMDYLIATKRIATRRIGTRVLIPIEDVRRFARFDHPERMAG